MTAQAPLNDRLYRMARDVAGMTPANPEDAWTQLGLVAAAYALASPAQRRGLRRAAAGVMGEAYRRGSVVVLDNRIARIEANDEGNRWWLVCEEHGGCVGVGDLRTARAEAAAPEGWCPGCQESGRKGGSP